MMTRMQDGLPLVLEVVKKAEDRIFSLPGQDKVTELNMLDRAATFEPAVYRCGRLCCSC